MTMIRFFDNESSNCIDAIFSLGRVQLWGVKNETNLYAPEVFNYDTIQVDICGYGGFRGNFYPIKMWKKQFLLHPAVIIGNKRFVSECTIYLPSCRLSFWIFKETCR